MLRNRNNMVFRVRVGSEDHKRYKETLPRLSRNVKINQTQPGLCWQKVKDVVDVNKSSMNKDGISHHAAPITSVRDHKKNGIDR